MSNATVPEAAGYIYHPDVPPSEEVLARARQLTLIIFAIVLPILWALPAAIICCCRACRSARRGAIVPASEAYAYNGVEEGARSTAVSKLSESEAASKRLRARVHGSMAQAGWMLVASSFFPLIISQVTNTPIAPIAGYRVFYMAGLPWGTGLLMLAVRAVDARIVRVTCIFLFCVMVVMSTSAALPIVPSLRDGNIMLAVGYIIFIFINFLLCVFMWPTFNLAPGCGCCCGRSLDDARRMAPRAQLRRAWIVVRCFFFFGALAAVNGILSSVQHGRAPNIHWHHADIVTSTFFVVISFVLASLVGTSALRGRLLAYLGSLGARGSKEQEAASVAALIGNSSAAESLATATEHFRAQPLATLTRAELMDKAPDPALHAKTVRATLGSVHAFASHSWSDDGSAKFDQLHEWAAGQEKLLWLDKACIDQQRIEASLASLPVFLAGCQQLLVLAGPTYTTRLWCVMELFVFVRMGGQRDAIVVQLLDKENEGLPASLARFDAARARCFLERDRQLLLAVIDASFGTVRPFNRLVRDIFRAQQLDRKTSSRAHA